MGAMGAMGPRRLGFGPGRSGPDFEWKGSALGPWGCVAEAPRAREGRDKRSGPVLGPPCKTGAECRDSSRVGY